MYREGKLNHVGKLGQVFVFNLENTLLRGLMGKGAAAFAGDTVCFRWERLVFSGVYGSIFQLIL